MTATTTRESLRSARRWVVKVGSALVTANGRGLDLDAIADWAGQVARLRADGRQVVWVSSGAVAEGLVQLGIARRPDALHALQAAAAVGQMGLVRAYDAAFAGHGLRAAQVLLTHDDVSSRARYLNARATLRALLEFDAVPVVNENDTVAHDEIRLGDNDTLGALTCNLIEADVLVILTDQQGLYEADPRVHPEAKLVGEAELSDPRLAQMAGGGRGELGRGGMQTKLKAAHWAARSGTSTIIAHGRIDNVLPRLAAGESIGTLLHPDLGVMAARKRWIAHQHQARGTLHLDAGAARVLRESGKSLLPVGVQRVEGVFERGDLVICLGPDGAEVARGLANYAAGEASRIAGHASADIAGLLGHVGEPELIHRDNLVITAPREGKPEAQ